MSADEPSYVATDLELPRARKAWAPNADAETAAVLRLLAVRPWLIGGRDDHAIATVRRNLSAVTEAVHRLGWVLVVERDLVRLRKSPPPRRAAWAAEGPRPAVCSWFFLMVAAAESLPPKAALGHLVAAARTAAAEAGLSTSNDIDERYSIMAAVKELQERGVIEILDGPLEAFLYSEDPPVLVAVHHTRLLHVIANPGPRSPADDPGGWLAEVEREPDVARRMRRRLLDDNMVYACDLDDAEANWLSRRVRGDDGTPLAAAFGLHVERRAEGAAFVVPEDGFRYPFELGPLRFPGPGTVAHAAWLLIAGVGNGGIVSGAPGPGWRGISGQDVRTCLAELANSRAAGSGGWKRELVEDPDELVIQVRRLLEGLDLLRVSAGEKCMWWLSPVTGRWRAAASSAGARPRRPLAPPTEHSARIPNPPRGGWPAAPELSLLDVDLPGGSPS